MRATAFLATLLLSGCGGHEIPREIPRQEPATTPATTDSHSTTAINNRLLKTATVSRVVDGDTIKLANGETVRLIDVDTPETVHPSKPVEAFGKEASDFTKSQLTGERIRLEYDQSSAATGHRGKYGRLLAYVFRDRDNLDFNAELIKQGYAHAYTKYPFSRMEEFRQYERTARENGRGLWAESPATIRGPPEKQPTKLRHWLNASSGVRHNASCRWYRNTKSGRMCRPNDGRACKICGG